jgi:thioredoxin reductase (NADPH)
LATGLFHKPPEVEGVSECLGKSMFFCKDCDGFRVRNKAVGVYGINNAAAEYALGMLYYTRMVAILTDGRPPRWDNDHQQWLEQHEIPVHRPEIKTVCHREGILQSLTLADGRSLELDALFTTRGDVYFNELAKVAGAKLDSEGQIITDHCQRTSVPGLYAAGCVTPANCQMIIAAGQGAIAAQSVSRELFEEELRSGALRNVKSEPIPQK